MTVGGVRFSKTFDCVQMIKRALKESGKESIPVTWVNDYTSLMERSYPTDPAGLDRDCRRSDKGRQRPP